MGMDTPFCSGGAERPDLVPAWYPDPLLTDKPWGPRVPPRSVAIHLTLHVPREARAGVYRGKVAVRGKKGQQVHLSVRLRVWPFVMPRPTFYVTNWFHSDCVTMWHRCEPWGPRHWRLLELYAREMAAHRQNVISTPALFGNFHNYDQMTLVDATRRRNGEYTFDLSRLERWVKLFDRHGFELFEMWHLASQGGGKTAPRVAVFDEAKGERIVYSKLSVNSPTYRKLVGSFLQHLSVWLERRGLLDRFLLHVFDEPEKSAWGQYSKLSEFYRRHAPRLRHLDAISTSDLITEFGADIDIPVPLIPHLAGNAYYQQRARAGEKPVWWYTCCGPEWPYANRFVINDLIATRILHWQAYVYGIGGYLHWGYNYWHRLQRDSYFDETLVNPYREAPSAFPVGDACIVYPAPNWWEDHGPVSSLRHEAMRKGLQDDALLRMLDSLVRAPAKSPRLRAAAGQGKRLLRYVREEIAPTVTQYTRDPDLLLAT